MDPILDPEDEALESALLRAGRDVGMSPDLRNKTLASLGIGAVGVGVATTTAKSGLWGWLTTKSGVLWTAGVVASASAGGAAVYAMQKADEPSPAALAVPRTAHVEKAPSAAAAEQEPKSEVPAVAIGDLPVNSPNNAADIASKTSSQVKPPRSSSAAAPSNASTLREELTQLAQVETALRSGSPTQALGLLQQYRSSFPRPQLGLEAEVLSIQALHDSGAKEQAHKRAARFIERHPQSPLGARAKQYL